MTLSFTGILICISIVYIVFGGIWGWYISITRAGKTGKDPWYNYPFWPAMFILIAPILAPVVVLARFKDWLNKK